MVPAINYNGKLRRPCSYSKRWVTQKQSTAAGNRAINRLLVGFSGSCLFAFLNSRGKLIRAATISFDISNNMSFDM